VGERGREVRPFIENALGQEGMRKSIVVVSTSDEPPLNRIRAADIAVAIADSFREQGKNVLLLLDSLTRYASAQKELGLMLGEPPASRGFPASVFQKVAILLEQMGNSGKGSITGIVTVLVDGDDMNEPVADTARSILDGHIVLRRELAEQNHYPAIDILASVSRVFREICTSDHVNAAATIRKTMALYREVLIRIGAYKKGNVAATDRAIDSMEHVNAFLQQSGSGADFQVTTNQLRQLAAFCNGSEGG
jgi:flagellum-specific ATP synthase